LFSLARLSAAAAPAALLPALSASRVNCSAAEQPCSSLLDIWDDKLSRICNTIYSFHVVSSTQLPPPPPPPLSALRDDDDDDDLFKTDT
jgi:hypothetical protein